MEQLSTYDYLFASIILISILLALIRGGVAEVLGLSTWFIAIFVMHHFAPELNRFIPKLISTANLRILISYIYAFFIVAIIIALIKKIFNQLIQSIGLNGVNHLFGAVLGFIRGIILCSLLIIGIELFHLDPQHSWQHSILAPLLLPILKIITTAVPSHLTIFSSPSLSINAINFYSALS
jgi:membrane protein required for colicin V production